MFIRTPGWDLGAYVSWMMEREGDPDKLTEAMDETIMFAAEISLVTPYGSVLADRCKDGKRWNIYVLDGSFVGQSYTTKGDEYAGGYGGRWKTDAERLRVCESLLNVLNFLVVWNQTPEELREELENSQESFRHTLSR